MTVDPLLAHLLRRAGFGASTNDLAAFAGLSYTDAVSRLVNYQAIPDDVDSHIGDPAYAGTTSNGAFSPNTVITDARQRWLFRILHSQRPLQEKMTLFWHNYFATGYTKVSGHVKSENATRLMAGKASEDPGKQQGQIELLRSNALGNFRQLLLAVAQDPAMLIWLDGDTNTKAAPQENFGREVMELFSRGYGFYTEQDVYAAARVFTGWNMKVTGTISDPSATFAFEYRPEVHETSAKTFSFPIYLDGTTTIPARSASAGMQDGIDLITALATAPQTAVRLATKLWGFFISETNPPDPNFINELATVYLQSNTEMAPVIQHLLLSAPFQDQASFFTRYSWPAEFVARALKEVGWTGFALSTALTPMINMSQELYEPPNVGGWSLGTGWFSSGAMLARMNFGSTLAASQKFNLGRAAAGAGSTAQGVLDFMLGHVIASPDDSIAADLGGYVTSQPWTGSSAQLQATTAGLAHLIVGSPEYQAV